MFLLLDSKLYAPVDGGWQPCNIVDGQITNLSGKQYKQIKNSEYKTGLLLTLEEVIAKFSINEKNYYFDDPSTTVDNFDGGEK